LWGCVVTNLPPKKSDLPVRAMSAVVMLAVAGTALWLGGWVWTLFVAAVALGVLWEWWGLAKAIATSTLARTVWLLCGALYCGLAAIVLSQSRSGSPLPLVLLLCAVMAVDIGAYFAGRAIGGPKIAPRISPSKTWAGLAGGAIGAGLVLAAAIGFIAWSDAVYRCGDAVGQLSSGPVDQCPPQFRWLYSLVALAAGLPLAVIAQAGDFFESWMKRRAGVKDSGKLIPGHGGLFDRVDGLLAVCFVIGLFMLASRVLG
jgi:phosphatidate cytidylyltransferase